MLHPPTHCCPQLTHSSLTAPCQAWALPPSTPASRVLSSLGDSHPLHRVYPHITAWPEELEVRERPSGSNPFELGALDPHTVRLISNHGQNRAVRSTTPFPDLPRSDDDEEETVWSRLARLFGCKSRIPPMLARLAAASAPLPPPAVSVSNETPSEAPAPRRRAKKAFSAPWVHADGSLDVMPRTVAYYEVRRLRASRFAGWGSWGGSLGGLGVHTSRS